MDSLQSSQLVSGDKLFNYIDEFLEDSHQPTANGLKCLNSPELIRAAAVSCSGCELIRDYKKWNCSGQ